MRNTQRNGGGPARALQAEEWFLRQRGFKRVTLSITKNLKAEMDKFPNVNWSAVARAAFAQTLFELTGEGTGCRDV